MALTGESLILQIAAAVSPGGVIGIIALAAVLALLVRAVWEPTSLDCRTVRIELPSPDARPLPALPDVSDDTFRLLLFSDLHAELFRIDPARLLEAFAASRPDLVLFAGDLAAHERHLTKALGLFRRIMTLPELQGIPFMAVRGNHDGDRSAAMMAAAGIRVLENEGQILTLAGQAWMVIGLEDLRTGRPDPSGALEQAELSGIPPERRLVMAHNPDTLLGLPDGSAAFFLSGHFHGGQIWLPFHLEFFLLRSEKLPRIGFFKGHFNWQGTQAYISRGLGCVSLPLRLFSRPELTLLEFSLTQGSCQYRE